jgi:hypothetical protein
MKEWVIIYKTRDGQVGMTVPMSKSSAWSWFGTEAIRLEGTRTKLEIQRIIKE